METIEQERALSLGGLTEGERADFWRARSRGLGAGEGMECLAARFTTHRYVPHTHETYVIGTIVSGCETFVVRGARRFAGPGSFCVINPGEVHDGEPYGEGYAYRMTYPAVGMVRAVAEEVTGRKVTATPFFRAPDIYDPEMAALFVAAHTALAGEDMLAGDQRYVAMLGIALIRHADIGGPARLGREPGPVARAKAWLEAHMAEDVDLASVAAVAGLSRFHLIRAFRKETGLTPHAWLTDLRVRRARRLLGEGIAPADVAQACGFADQSHLTRAFKARVGTTPGRFRVEVRGEAAARAA
ncbi:AraC family transcriptional regulator [Tepidamorphus gemmatus]|uniref:AraC family transcriptional regulator n=1 Tax=Tepidamorphus gemmatus TaxID=747076 RepID=A0A4R3MJD7_9HYPH|nr:AraC family transcriptional regulator [Tepidamorphus gemmatus]TCT13514.1 AraC family transcriptional regulator [Tepidamorphus gemmatus]